MHRGTTEQKAYQAIRYQNEIWLHTSRISRSYEKVSPSLSLSLSLSLCFALSPQSLAEVVNGRVVLHFPRVRTHRRLKRLIDRDAQALKSTTNEVLQDRNQITTCQLVFHCHSHSYILSPLDLNFCSILMNQWKCCDMFQ